MLVFASPTLLLEVDDTNFPGLVVRHEHLSHLLYVHGTNDKVLDLRVGPLDSKVLVGLLESYMLKTVGNSFQMSPAQAHLSMSLHPEFVVI